MLPKDVPVYEMTNSADPDQTTPLEVAVYTVCLKTWENNSIFPFKFQSDYSFALSVETPNLEDQDQTFFFSLSSDQEYAYNIWIDGINALLGKAVSIRSLVLVVNFFEFLKLNCFALLL